MAKLYKKMLGTILYDRRKISPKSSGQSGGYPIIGFTPIRWGCEKTVITFGMYGLSPELTKYPVSMKERSS